jgi:hypothetical protein
LLAEARRVLDEERHRAEQVAARLADRLSKDADQATDHIARAAHDLTAGVGARN